MWLELANFERLSANVKVVMGHTLLGKLRPITKERWALNLEKRESVGLVWIFGEALPAGLVKLCYRANPRSLNHLAATCTASLGRISSSRRGFCSSVAIASNRANQLIAPAPGCQ